MLRQLRLKLTVSLREALFIVGTDAKARPSGDPIAEACERVAALVGDVPVSIEVPAAHLLCQAAEELRRRGDAEAVDVIEGLIREMKAGKNKRIIGRMAFGARSMGEVDGALEEMRKVAEKKLGG